MCRNFIFSFLSFLLTCQILSVSGQEKPIEFKSIGYYKKLNSQPDTVYYKKVDNNKLRLLVMQPNRQNKKQKCPVMVWIHGGAWTAGSPEGYIPHLRYSAALGAVGVAIEYRLVASPGKLSDMNNTNTVTDCITDCADAIRYLRKHANELGIDPNKIIVIGDSAGGHLALCLGVLDLPKDEKANIVINCNGIADMTGEKWIKYIQPGNKQEETAKRLSPINYLDAGDPPVLTMHGAKDQVVTPGEAEKFYNSCKKAGMDTEYILWPDMRHAFIVTNYTATEEQTDRALATMDAFLFKRGFLQSVH